MPRPNHLRSYLGDASLLDRHATLDLCSFLTTCYLDGDTATLAGARVLVRTSDQLSSALALIDLDGIAASLVIAPPELKDEHLASVINSAGVDTLVTDRSCQSIQGLRSVRVSLEPHPVTDAGLGIRRTEWVMFTSGTSGTPKMVSHNLEGLTGAIDRSQPNLDTVWGTFYDIRRYGGLQVFLRALLGHAPLILSNADESVSEHLTRLGRGGVTHLTGTPSHWRRALMSPVISAIAPRYLRLSGEIADQAILDKLRVQFPNAGIAHAYASTEAGVGFEVADGLEGFPAWYIGRPGPVEMKLENGSLHIRSDRTAVGYVGGLESLKKDGFVDTGDMIEQRGDRCYFAGRRGGIINVGGLKIHPEEVEAIINRHPGVRLSRVSARRSPITGAIAVADVVLSTEAGNEAAIKREIVEICRANLPAAKVPVVLRVVPTLELTAGGKLARPYA